MNFLSLQEYLCQPFNTLASIAYSLEVVAWVSLFEKTVQDPACYRRLNPKIWHNLQFSENKFRIPYQA